MTVRNAFALAALIALAALPVAAESPREPPQAALELDTTAIKGNRELPKVMVVVPWKQAAPALPAGRPMNSLVEKLLTPVDRDVFRRELAWHNDAQERRALAEQNNGAATMTSKATKDRNSEE